MTTQEELKIYKQAVMNLVDSVGLGPKSSTPVAKRPCKFVWMVHGENPCDIRRYAYSREDAIDMVADKNAAGWTLYKLVKISKQK